ncbi:MAG TPA: histidine ammonia-lyase [Rubricoccaceae bacterium]|jgi:histidine ammonia-lyase
MTPLLPVAPSAVVLRLATLDADLDRSLTDLRACLGTDRCRVAQSRAVVETALADGGTHYGLNTGFGSLKSVRVDAERLVALQENLLRSHAVGVGAPVGEALSLRMLRLKVHALGLGFSGVSVPVFERLLTFAEHGLAPVVPAQGSLGASGDLAPLAHLALPLLGEGQIWHNGTPRAAADVLAAHGLAPVPLAPKDGLALINGTQFMAAVGGEALARALRLADTADVTAAMTLEGIRGSAAPFDARVHAVRPHAGAVTVAERVRGLLVGSEIGPSHAGCDRVQDPYSVRCVPQVHGASRDALAYALGQFETEFNSVTDNPLVFPGAPGGGPEEADLISAGNFHGQPLALAADMVAIAAAELASISERRTYLLLDGTDRLPPYLVAEPGLQSGFMMVQYTAAALVSENKTLCHPASVDSIPSSRGQEDHVSMGAWGARKALQVVENAERVLACEALCAAQALDFRRPLRAGHGVERAFAAVRARVPYRTADTVFEPDLAACTALVASGDLARAAD